MSAALPTSPHPEHPLVIDDTPPPGAQAPNRGCLGGLFGWLLATGAAAWLAPAALWLGGTNAPGGLRVAAAVAVGLFWLRAFANPGARWLLVIAAVVVALVARSIDARTDRDWIPAHERQAWLEDGAPATLHDVRDFRYPTVEDEAETRWKDLQLSVDQVVGLDFVLVRFGEFEGLAHTMVSFELDDGRFISISPEARYEEGETYSPLRGMFRQYELIYVIGLERDVLGVRTNVRRNDVYVYRLNIQPETARRVFVEMTARAGELRTEPRWYHSLTTSCASTLVDHYEQTSGESVGPDPRAWLPGFSDSLVAELGLLGDVDPHNVEAMRAAAWVNPRAAEVSLDDPAWSLRIRGR